ncbi:MAG TPA: isoprenylcysteine carboxylmethyltransferase family protein [Planktothrix sp.]|jgi:protein-S-isoprenylcysteine O-methyltransferase Ste14
MNSGAFTIIILDFVYIGLLPKIFFKTDGSFNIMWWATALPFLLSSGSCIATMCGYLPPMSGVGTEATSIMQLLSVLFSVASIALISFTLGTHRIPIALWHQNNDAPKGIVTWGAYGQIRHPFYASFILAFTGALLFSLQIFTVIGLIYGLIILNTTAAREEKRLSHSEFGQEYIEYIAKTGRFFPRSLGKN